MTEQSSAKDIAQEAIERRPIEAAIGGNGRPFFFNRLHLEVWIND